MAFRVDSEGYRLGLDGKRIDTSEADRVKFKAEIQAAWEAAHSGAVPADQTIMIVEKGDCQWTIAEDAGADPADTAYAMNGQFSDPDLIHPGEAVFLGKVNEYKTGPEGNNADIFGDSVNTRAAKGADPTLTLDATRYMASVPEAERLAVLKDLLAKADSSAARQAIIEGYLRSFEPSEQAAKGSELQAFYQNSPDESSSTHWGEIYADVNAVLKKMEISS